MAKFKASEMGKWTQEQKKKMRSLVRDSGKEVARRAQSNAPEDSGALKDSLVVEINGVRVGEGREAYEDALNRVQIGDFITVGWTADHALTQEFGGVEGKYNRSGKFFLGKALMDWPSIVESLVAPKSGGNL